MWGGACVGVGGAEQAAFCTREAEWSQPSPLHTPSLIPASPPPQMRKICNHPDLITSPFSSEMEYPTPEDMVRGGRGVPHT